MHTPRFGPPTSTSAPASFAFARPGSPAHLTSSLPSEPGRWAHIDNAHNIYDNADINYNNNDNIININQSANDGMSTLTTTVMMVNSSAAPSGPSAMLELGFAGTPSAGTGTGTASAGSFLHTHTHGFGTSVGARPDAAHAECGSGNGDGAENAGGESVGSRAWRFGRSAGEVELETQSPSARASSSSTSLYGLGHARSTSLTYPFTIPHLHPPPVPDFPTSSSAPPTLDYSDYASINANNSPATNTAAASTGTNTLDGPSNSNPGGMAGAYAGADGTLPQLPLSTSVASSAPYGGGQAEARNEQSQSQGYQSSSAPLPSELSLSASLSPPHRGHASHAYAQHAQQVTGSLGTSGTTSPSTPAAGVHSPTFPNSAAPSRFVPPTSSSLGGGSRSITAGPAPAGANTSTNSVTEDASADANLLPAFLLPGSGLNGETRARAGADLREGEVGVYPAGQRHLTNSGMDGNGNGIGNGSDARTGSDAGSPGSTLLGMRERRTSGGPFGRGRYTLPTPQPHPVLFPHSVYIGSDGGSPETSGSAEPASTTWLSPGSNAPIPPPGSSPSASEPCPGSASGSAPTHPLSPGNGRFASSTGASSSAGNAGSSGNGGGNYGTSSGLDAGLGSSPGSGSSPYMHALQGAHAHAPRLHGHATARMQLDSPRTHPAPFGFGLNSGSNHSSPVGRASRPTTTYSAQMNMSMNDYSGAYPQAQRSPVRLPSSLPMHMQQHPRTRPRTSPGMNSMAYQTPSPVSGPVQQQFSPPPLYLSTGISVSRPTSSAGSIGGRLSISGWAPSPGPSSANGAAPAFEQVLNEDMPHLSGSFSKSPLSLPITTSLSAANFSPASSSSISINAENGHGHQHHQNHGLGHASSMLLQSHSHLLNTPGGSTPSLINNSSSATFTNNNAAGPSTGSSHSPGVASGTHTTNTAPSPSYSTSTSHSDPPSGASSRLLPPFSKHSSPRQPSLSFSGYQQQSLPALVPPSDLSYISTPILRDGNSHGFEEKPDTISMGMQIGLGQGESTPGPGTGPTTQLRCAEGNTDGVSSSASYNVPRPTSGSGSSGMRNTNAQPKNEASNPTSSSTRAAGTTSGRSPRKKNHGCWMCHKSFDRPSTLRKHLLVHTGEKAFVCNICGRRFGVASNLNRHTRRCAQKPVNAARGSSTGIGTNPPAQNFVAPQAPEQHQYAESSAMAISASNPDANKSVQSSPAVFPVRGRRQPARRHSEQALPPAVFAESGIGLRDGSHSGSGSGSDVDLKRSPGAGQQPKPKRRRRAPSPSRWVPDSLRNFDLEPTRKAVSTPLPPVRPYCDPVTGDVEERDSYASSNLQPDENTAPAGASSAASMRMYEAPYHPCGWTGRLPGPAVVVGGDLTNLAGSSNGHPIRGAYTFTFVTGIP